MKRRVSGKWFLLLVFVAAVLFAGPVPMAGTELGEAFFRSRNYAQ